MLSEIKKNVIENNCELNTVMFSGLILCLDLAKPADGKHVAFVELHLFTSDVFIRRCLINM